MRAITPSGTGFEFCINCYDGCAHGCLYCYARLRKVRKYESWINPVPRLNILDWLKKDVRSEEANLIRDIFVCSACDAYQPLELRYGITRRAVEILIANELPFTVLSKSANLLRDLDLFKYYPSCRVGFTIITLDERFKQTVEPYSSSIAERCEGLEILKREGISTYLSVEPILCQKESDPFEIVRALKPYVDLFEFGKWSPYVKKGIPGSYDEQYYVELFKELIPFCTKEKVHFCIAKHTEQFLRGHGFTFVPHLLVTDRPYPKPFGGFVEKRVL